MKKPSRTWVVPSCLRLFKLNEDAFRKWLDRKARSVRRRDRRRGIPMLSLSKMKGAIIDAICRSNGRDHYTGENLDWKLIGTWARAAEGQRGAEYRRQFLELPSVDHDFTNPMAPQFHICSWRMNDAKNDLTVQEFLALAKKVDQHIRQSRK